MTNWNDEMDRMLAAFKQQTIFSLSKIELAFEQNGQFFNDDFKQYFLQASNHCIEEAYDQFKIGSMFKIQAKFGTGGNTSTIEEWSMMDSVQSSSYSTNNDQQQLNHPVETIELNDDEKDQPGYRTELELLEDMTFDTPELNDIYQKNDDGSNTETDIAKKVEDLKVDDHVMNCGMTTRIECSSNVTMNNGPNFIDLMQKQSNNEKSPPSAQFEMKKRFMCNICKYSTNIQCNIKRHVRIHTGEKPYQCDICHKGFAQSNDLKKHMRTHTGEKPYRCDICYKEFTQSSSMKKHKMIHIN